MHTYCVWIIGLLSITSYVCDIGSSELTSDHRLQYKESLTRGEVCDELEGCVETQKNNNEKSRSTLKCVTRCFVYSLF